MGKISKKVIEERKMDPPFIPNLEEYNFDLEEIKVDLKEIMRKVEEDRKMKKFVFFFDYATSGIASEIIR